jgi:hypothetical protein
MMPPLGSTPPADGSSYVPPADGHDHSADTTATASTAPSGGGSTTSTSEGATAGSGVAVIATPDNMRAQVVERFKRGEHFVVQPALKGNEEFKIHFMAHHGRLLAAEYFHSILNGTDKDVKVKGIKNKPTNKGKGWLGCNNETNALRMVEQVVVGTLYNGMGCLQFKKDVFSGDPRIIELNPRTCGGIMKHE